MVFNSLMVMSVAHASADAWQCLACLPERLSSHQLLDLVLCFPLQQLGRLALCIWTFLCLPPPDTLNSYSYSSDDSDSSSSSSTTVDYDGYYYHSHSD
ncbi:hypothetical protein L484_019129 [Morus notabilis]|uniref:Uncharacterized protein n=1 Tax=Morus notabilis TaxID=981085 RepID=W9SZJ5_9ROSA|nr:uncharacterized protein LOC21402081 [Morus notabilis]EXC34530.1 hypothetical protein L484_019129 [Morus notabilis]